MKRSKIEQVVAEMRAEYHIVAQCLEAIDTSGNDKTAVDVLTEKCAVLTACIARLSGNGTEAPKPARTRKSRKATEPTL